MELFSGKKQTFILGLLSSSAGLAGFLAYWMSD
jgi:hypothetical protein